MLAQQVSVVWLLVLCCVIHIVLLGLLAFGLKAGVTDMCRKVGGGGLRAGGLKRVDCEWYGDDVNACIPNYLGGAVINYGPPSDGTTRGVPCRADCPLHA